MDYKQLEHLHNLAIGLGKIKTQQGLDNDVRYALQFIKAIPYSTLLSLKLSNNDVVNRQTITAIDDFQCMLKDIEWEYLYNKEWYSQPYVKIMSCIANQ